MRAFSPSPGATVKLSAGTSSSRVQFQTSGMGKPGSLRLFNAGPVTIFVELGGSAVAAAVATGMPVPPGAVETIGPQGGSHIAGITASGTADLYVTPGEGV